MKQTGGHGQYAVCNIEIEPLGHGEGFVYDDKIFGGAIPHQFIPSIEKGIVKTMAEGVLSGNPMVDLKVTLVDGKFHPVDSCDMAFQIAGSMALKDAVEQAGVALLEPIVDLEVVVPEAYTGDIMGDLNAKRGKIAGMEQIGGGKQRIRAQVPQAEVARYVIDLRSMTGGRGAYSVTFSHYEEMPQHLAQKVIDEYQAARADASSRTHVARSRRQRGACCSRNGSTASSNASGARRFTTWSASIETSRPSSTSCAIRCDGATHVRRVLLASTTSVGTSISREPLRRGRIERLRAGLVHRQLVDVVAGDLLDARARRVVDPERRPDLEQQVLRAFEVAGLDRRVDRRRQRVPPRFLFLVLLEPAERRPRPARAPTRARAPSAWRRSRARRPSSSRRARCARCSRRSSRATRSRTWEYGVPSSLADRP